MRTLISLICTLALSFSAHAQEPQRYFLGVGIDEYPDATISSMKYCQSDTENLGKFFKEQKYEVTLLLSKAENADSKPTKANIERAIKAVLKKAKRDDLIVLFIATKGLQFAGSDDALLVPIDGVPTKEKVDSLVSMKWISEQLEGSFASGKVVLVDASRNAPDPTRSVAAPASLAPAKGSYAYLFSCNPGERAYESDELKAGLSAHSLLAGLSGGAVDSDGEVTLNALATFVQKEVWRLTRKLGLPKQNPNLKADYSGVIVLANKPAEKLKQEPVK